MEEKSLYSIVSKATDDIEVVEKMQKKVYAIIL